MRCETTAADLWLLAAGELSNEDAERLGGHVARCARCSERLANASLLFRDTGVDSVHPVAPPPDLKAQLMARVAATRPAHTRPSWMRLAAAAVAGVLLGAGAVGWWLNGHLSRSEEREERLRFELTRVRESNQEHEMRLAHLSARIQELEHGLERAEHPVSFGPEIEAGTERARAWRAFLQWTEESRPMAGSRTDARPRTTGMRPNLGTTAQVFCLESERLCRLRAAGLPTPKSGQSYALWLTNMAGRYYLVGTFEVDANGEASLLASAPVDVRDVARSVVTLEPGEAGWRPAGSVVLVDETLAN